MTLPAAVPSRLKWKCRRGMREMDILLGRFLDRGYPDLDAAGRDTFERLLELPDQDLLAWLSGNGLPKEAQLKALIEQIRQVVHAP